MYIDGISGATKGRLERCDIAGNTLAGVAICGAADPLILECT